MVAWVTAGLVAPEGQAASASTPPGDGPGVTQRAVAQHGRHRSGGGVLPDAACTPGATNPAVTQATIGSTICRSGYTATIRPPASYTDALKRQQIAAYGYTDTSPRSYEEDHLISLELGGASSDQRNLWPEPAPSPSPLSSTTSATALAALFGGFAGTMGLSDFPQPFISGVRHRLPRAARTPAGGRAVMGSPGSRAWRFCACPGSLTARGPLATRASATSDSGLPSL